jgi:hypothetical protein
MNQALRFDPEAHRYFLGNREVPGVSAILKSAGFQSAFYRSEEGARFGTVGHQVLHLLLSGRLGEYDPAFEPWMRGIRKFVDEQKPEPYDSPARGLERIVFSDLGYAGTMDFAGTCKRFGKKLCILDWKFWSNSPSNLILGTAGLQTAAYSKAFAEYEMLRMPIERAAVWFFEDGYRMFPMTDATDWNFFLSALNCYKWRERHGLKEDV